MQGYTLTQEHPRITLVTRDRDGWRVGRILHIGKTFRASRVNGTDDDIRRVGDGFRSIETAAAWIAKAAA